MAENSTIIWSRDGLFRFRTWAGLCRWFGVRDGWLEAAVEVLGIDLPARTARDMGICVLGDYGFANRIVAHGVFLLKLISGAAGGRRFFVCHNSCVSPQERYIRL